MKQYVKDLIKNKEKFHVKTSGGQELTEVLEAFNHEGVILYGGTTEAEHYKCVETASSNSRYYVLRTNHPDGEEIPLADILGHDGFEVGDKVRAFGLDGEVTDVETSLLCTYPVLAKFENDYFSTFTADGKLHQLHKEPSLILVERPVKKVKKSFWLWADARGVVDDRLMDDKFTTPSGSVVPSFVCNKLPGTEVTLEVEVK